MHSKGHMLTSAELSTMRCKRLPCGDAALLFPLPPLVAAAWIGDGEKGASDSIIDDELLGSTCSIVLDASSRLLSSIRRRYSVVRLLLEFSRIRSLSSRRSSRFRRVRVNEEGLASSDLQEIKYTCEQMWGGEP